MTSTAHPPSARSPFGDHLRHWRQHRRLSQQGLALEADISTRHLSYLETGRSAPSREMVLRLAERLPHKVSVYAGVGQAISTAFS